MNERNSAVVLAMQRTILQKVQRRLSDSSKGLHFSGCGVKNNGGMQTDVFGHLDFLFPLPRSLLRQDPQQLC